MNKPRVVRAENPGDFTLDGTRTFLVGKKNVAVIDPGPEVQEHLRALSHAVAGAERVTVLLTHDHPDHAEGAEAFARGVGAIIHGGKERPLEDETRFGTDEGDVVALYTPGHTLDHFAFHWPQARALFAGDLVLGAGATTWIGEYRGCVADYLASLVRIRGLGLDIVYPAHGPPIDSVEETLERYESHRLDRIGQVAEVVARYPGASPIDVVHAVYGTELPSGLEEAARMSVEVMMEHLRTR